MSSTWEKCETITLDQSRQLLSCFTFQKCKACVEQKQPRLQVAVQVNMLQILCALQKIRQIYASSTMSRHSSAETNWVSHNSTYLHVCNYLVRGPTSESSAKSNMLGVFPSNMINSPKVQRSKTVNCAITILNDSSKQIFSTQVLPLLEHLQLRGVIKLSR